MGSNILARISHRRAACISWPVIPHTGAVVCRRFRVTDQLTQAARLAAMLLVCLIAGVSAQERPAATFRRPASALEILRKFDIGDSQFGGFFSGQPLGAA
ncbi:MAG: hypothetical protein IAF94_03740, partial [Pirellulaceae bacterium]|nr:hypothetical protein [Pirellulaceae bacterium]